MAQSDGVGVDHGHPELGGEVKALRGVRAVDEDAAAGLEPGRYIDRLHEARVEDDELVSLVWESAAALGARDAEILDLGLRHGMSPAEIGETVGMNRNAANQAVHRARNRLKTAVEARVLWRSGEPVCAGLAAALTAADVGHFGPEAVRVTTRHAEKCAECQERRQMRLEPSAMFGALPFLAVPWLLKMKVAHALSESGVPMAGSEAVSAPDPDAPRRGRNRLRRKGLVGAGIVAVVAVVGVGAFADPVHEARLVVADGPKVTTTTGEDTTTTTVAVVAPTDLPSTTTATTKPVVFVPPPPPTSPPTAPPETGTASINAELVPSRVGPPYIRLTWSSSGGTRVSVVGTRYSSTLPSGSATIPIQTGSYSITDYGSRGQVLASASDAV